MARYRIRAPDGASYEIEGPEGASDADVQAEVARQYPEAVSGSQGPSPGASGPPEGIVGTINAGLKGAREWMQPAANNLVNFATSVGSQFVRPGSAFEESVSGPRSLFSGPTDETRAAPSSGAGRFAAEVVNPVPGNITDAAAQVGTLGMGPSFRILNNLLGGAGTKMAGNVSSDILSRILGGAAGAGIGQAVEGGDAAAVGKAAGLAGLANTAGEGLAGGVSLLAKSLPGGVTRIRNKDAARMLEAAPEISPGLGRITPEGRTSSEALQDLVVKGKQGLNDAKEEAVQRIESVLQSPARGEGAGGVGLAEGPTGRIADRGAMPDIQDRVLERANAPAALPQGEAWQPRDLIGPRGVNLEIPSLGSVSLREANAELTAIGQGLRHKDILDPQVRQAERARAYAELTQEITQALDAQSPGLGAAFKEAQQSYSAGMETLRRLEGSANWNPGSQGIEFDSRALQRRLAKSPLQAQRMGERMGDEGSNAFIDALTRGEGLGRVDKIPSGGGGLMDALMEWLRGKNSGTGGMFQTAVRSPLPNIGAQYIGKKPYSMDPGIKSLIDLGILKGTEAGVSAADMAEIRAAQEARQTAADDPSLQLEMRRRR